MRFNAPAAIRISAQEATELVEIVHHRIGQLLGNVDRFAQARDVRDGLAIHGWVDRPLKLAGSGARSGPEVPRLTRVRDLPKDATAAVPVAPATLGPIDAMQLESVVRRQLRDLRATLEGSAERQGLRQLGTELVAALASVGS